MSVGRYVLMRLDMVVMSLCDEWMLMSSAYWMSVVGGSGMGMSCM